MPVQSRELQNRFHLNSMLLAQALEASNQPTVLLETSLRKFSAATLAQYLRAVRTFLAIHEPTLPHRVIGGGPGRNRARDLFRNGFETSI